MNELIALVTPNNSPIDNYVVVLTKKGFIKRRHKLTTLNTTTMMHCQLQTSDFRNGETTGNPAGQACSQVLTNQPCTGSVGVKLQKLQDGCKLGV
jgi:hypothetical protein